MPENLMRALVIAIVFVGVGCGRDACNGVDGTCVALTVAGSGIVDGVELTLSGAATGTRVAPSTATVQPLPVDIAVALGSRGGQLHIEAVGVYYGAIVGSGSVDVTVASGAHTSATVTLTPGGGGGDGGVALPVDVSGTRVRHFVLGDGAVVDVPTDFTGTPIAALEPTDGGVTKIVGTGDANGNFTIPRVRVPYYLAFGHGFVFGATTRWDLGQWYLGRPDATLPTSATTLALSMTNLVPWATGDTLELFAFNAGTFAFGLESLATPAPAAGVTSWNASIDFRQLLYGYLIDASKGDTGMIEQLVTDTNNGVPYQRLARVTSLPPLTMTNGNPTTTSAVAFTDVPQTGSTAVAFMRSQFVPLESAINPKATAVSDLIDIYAQPFSLAHGTFSSTPDIAVANPPTGTSDVSLTMTYGNPFPSSWPLVVAAGSTANVSYTATGASAGSYSGSIWTYVPLASLPPAITPAIGPVQALTIDGADGFTAQMSASATPVIAWMPPATGTPSGYGLFVFALDNVGGTTSFRQVTTIFTTMTSVMIPPGTLAGGQLYFVQVQAYADALDHNTAPFQAVLPTAFADALSAPLQVATVALGASCKDIHAANPALPDGVYTIDVDGAQGAAPPVDVDCDMTTLGGGWTLCAWNVDSTKETVGWAAPKDAMSSNWYACQKYSPTPIEMYVRVANAGTAYVNQFANVDVRPSVSAQMTYMPSVSLAPNFSLTLLPNSDACGGAGGVQGNFQWSVGTNATIFGVPPHCNCSNCMSNPSSFITTPGAVNYGCQGPGQETPNIGYPCGGDGDHGIHLELWAR